MTQIPVHATVSRHPHSLLVGLVAAVLVATLVFWGLVSRSAARSALEAEVQSSALTTVITTHPQVEPAFDEIVLPGQVKGEFETPIYARTNGYIRSWRTDIGARVKVGELLAVIDSPEVDQQLRQAEADLNAAQANAAVARGNADRAEQLVVTHSVSRQEAEDRAAAATATAAQVSANLANVGRLRELQSFERVVAPFSGVITARSTDVGALIDAGGTRGTELFRISATDKLRTYVDVPQSYANGIVVGIRATLQFPERPRKTYPATVIRTASAIDPQSRTLTVELNIDNRSGELLPGSFTEAHFRLPTDGHALQLPGNALLFRAEGTQVAAVGPDGRVELKSITLGRDFGTEVEILNGLASSDQVILNPPAAIESGDHVRVASAGAQAQKAGS